MTGWMEDQKSWGTWMSFAGRMRTRKLDEKRAPGLFRVYTLRGTNISHLGKRTIIFKSALVGDMLVLMRVGYLLRMKYHPLRDYHLVKL